MPVMFFIHGGAFYAGTQIKMGPERLGDVADIVLVAINYRVGPLGEISHNCSIKKFKSCVISSP
jgi:carboxylesterase type B